MKRGISFVGLLVAIFLIQFASADVLGISGLDSELILLAAIFIVLFTIFAVPISNSRYFNKNPIITSVLAGAFALIIVWFINKSSFNVENFFLDIGLPSDLVIGIGTIVIIIGVIIGIFKFKSKFFLVIGALITLAGIVFEVYESGFIITLGVIIFALGLIFFVWGYFRQRNNPFTGGQQPGSTPGNYQSYLNQIANEVRIIDAQLRNPNTPRANRENLLKRRRYLEKQYHAIIKKIK